MKPIFKKVESQSEEAFVAKIDQFSQFYNKWHFHPELELTHIVKGRGTRFIGDHIEYFEDGDLILVGSDLPHVWKNQNDDSELAVAQVVQFLPSFLGNDMLRKIEFKNVQNLIAQSSYGLKIVGITKDQVLVYLDVLFNANNSLDRLITLIRILDLLGTSSDLIPMSKSLFMVKVDKQNVDRLNQVIDYTITNFAARITLEDIASLSNMSVSNFCKYFKGRMKKTYVQYLTEVRIGMSCKLLIENKLSVHQIAFESGFVNMSNFNRAFKLTKGMTPLFYRKSFHLE
jgi:AraC-like DNA-binding protein/quercetin dioxygenase-like cupin family protein